MMGNPTSVWYETLRAKQPSSPSVQLCALLSSQMSMKSERGSDIPRPRTVGREKAVPWFAYHTLCGTPIHTFLSKSPDLSTLEERLRASQDP